MKDLDVQEGLCHVTASAPLQAMFGYTSFLRSVFIFYFFSSFYKIRKQEPNQFQTLVFVVLTRYLSICDTKFTLVHFTFNPVLILVFLKLELVLHRPLCNVNSPPRKSTSGMGTFTMEFSQNKPVEPHIQEQLIADYRETKAYKNQQSSVAGV